MTWTGRASEQDGISITHQAGITIRTSAQADQPKN
jgi:hypothetical protein